METLRLLTYLAQCKFVSWNNKHLSEMWYLDIQYFEYTDILDRSSEQKNT